MLKIEKCFLSIFSTLFCWELSKNILKIRHQIDESENWKISKFFTRDFHLEKESLQQNRYSLKFQVRFCGRRWKNSLSHSKHCRELVERSMMMKFWKFQAHSISPIGKFSTFPMLHRSKIHRISRMYVVERISNCWNWSKCFHSNLTETCNRELLHWNIEKLKTDSSTRSHMTNPHLSKNKLASTERKLNWDFASNFLNCFHLL